MVSRHHSSAPAKTDRNRTYQARGAETDAGGWHLTLAPPNSVGACPQSPDSIHTHPIHTHRTIRDGPQAVPGQIACRTGDSYMRYSCRWCHVFTLKLTKATQANASSEHGQPRRTIQRDASVLIRSSDKTPFDYFERS